ncbi:hypothetical protein [Prosthecobacter sp.]|uniref:hypothetical protein n=1 Tax=Prosthecobacter sp. TaxID=1965333 RepID=UPI0037850399
MKLLFDPETQALKPYPRSDDEPVVGLDPRYIVLDVVQAPQPALSAGQVARATETVNLETRQVLRGWDVVTFPKKWTDTQAFMAAFTDAEKAAIDLSTDPEVAAMRRTLDTWSGTMEPYDARVQAGLDRLVTLGILTAERVDAIVATAA